MVDSPGELSPVDDVFVSHEHASASRPSHPHFPSLNLNPQRRYDSLAKSSFTGSPVRRSSPLNPGRNPPNARTRTRMHSVDVGIGGSATNRSVPHSTAIPPTRHTPTHLAEDTDWEGSSFSNEYDLSHEDPRILQEVQRAIKLKARREARFKKGAAISPPNSPISSSSPTSISSPGNGIPPEIAPVSRLSPSPVNGNDISSNASPSASLEDHHNSTRSSSHPIPSSSDSGMTLDWGPSSEEGYHERRWALHHRKRDKEKFTPLATMSDHQDLMHTEKLARLRGIITPRTAHNASVLHEQLTRRYALIYASISSPGFNLSKASRWYRSQDPDSRDSLEKAEPLTWLRYRDKRTTRRKHNSWNMSALIMEEYIHYQLQRDNDSFPLSHVASTQRLTSSISETSGTQSASRPFRHIEPIPLAKMDTKIDAESRKSVESGFSSLQSGISHPAMATLSSATTRSRARELGIPNYKIRGIDTDVSSARNSLSDQSDLEPPGLTKKSRDIRGTPDNHFAPSHTRSRDETPAAPSPKPFGLSTSRDFLIPDTTHLQMSSGRRSIASVGQALDGQTFENGHDANNLQSFEHQRSREEEEEELRRQYQMKLSLLEEAMAHNQRVRQLLNRISSSVRDLESSQKNAEKLVGIPHTQLPQELIEAFGLDPAAVTGVTRSLRGWRAVEDIHHRLVRQRTVFRDFLQKPEAAYDSRSVLDDPITSLIRSLGMLESCKDEVAVKTKDIGEALNRVQNLHAEVKVAYNSTLSHTAVVYPELSQIVALEESYRDQYQQFWEFGMDALTFLLDTVTPVWRTYGKRIGEDVRDFLIIPLYRNEFTGEARKYPIVGLPKRSLRHWLGLLVFSFSSVTVVILQARAATSSTIHYRLQWIPYEEMRWMLLPLFWSVISLQWLAVMVESMIVFMQVGVIFWWIGWLVGIFT